MRSGDKCSGCENGILRVSNTVTSGNRRTQYLACQNKDCNFTSKDSFIVDDAGRRILEVDQMRETISRQQLLIEQLTRELGFFRSA
ncbi:hypothetical protein NHH03_22365 [Stieleria sp. TO1_6]|nr:hypothetical protein [Stieleria tagensis]